MSLDVDQGQPKAGEKLSLCRFTALEGVQLLFVDEDANSANGFFWLGAMAISEVGLPVARGLSTECSNSLPSYCDSSNWDRLIIKDPCLAWIHNVNVETQEAVAPAQI